jgi:hypothetical protein
MPHQDRVLTQIYKGGDSGQRLTYAAPVGRVNVLEVRVGGLQPEKFSLGFSRARSMPNVFERASGTIEVL